MFKNIIKRESGFTLLELLIVIVIIAILALLIIPNITSAPKKARDTQRKTDLRAIQKALEEYFVSNNAYPIATGEASLVLGGVNPPGNTGPLTNGNPPVMKLVPHDPKAGSPADLHYQYDSTGQSYDLYGCLENGADTGQFVTTDAGTCPTSTKKFTLTNQN